MINVQFFPDFVGNSRVRKPKKAQTNKEHIMGVQYFPGIWSCLSVHKQEWCQLHPIVYPLLITLYHNLLQLPLSPPPPPEYAPLWVWVGIQKHITASPPDRQKNLIRRGRHTLPLPTSPPTTALMGTHLSSHPSTPPKSGPC